MSALKLCTQPGALPGADETSTPTLGDEKADTTGDARQKLPATLAAERLPPTRRLPTHRPGAITPRQPLNALSSARRAAQAPAAAMPHPDAAHHVETQEPAQARSQPLSALMTVNSTLDLDVCERPDTMALPRQQGLTADLRRPDARALAELDAAARLRGKR